jgi:hypothetical protein
MAYLVTIFMFNIFMSEFKPFNHIILANFVMIHHLLARFAINTHTFHEGSFQHFTHYIPPLTSPSELAIPLILSGELLVIPPRDIPTHPPAVPRSLFSPGTPAPFIPQPSAMNGNSTLETGINNSAYLLAISFGLLRNCFLWQRSRFWLPS